MVYLALDPGLSKIGVAISHEGKLVAPLATFPAHQIVDHVQKLIAAHQPDVIVVGEPNSGPIKELAVVLHDEIKRIFTGKVVLHSEDLSSGEARQKMVEAGIPKNRRQAGDHSVAAAIILQDYLDLHHTPGV